VARRFDKSYDISIITLYTANAINRKFCVSPLTRVSFEKATVVRLLKIFPAFEGTRRFITVYVLVLISFWLFLFPIFLFVAQPK
jgi:hypothetical protein